MNVNAKQFKSLITDTIWKKQLNVTTLAETLMQAIGTEEHSDFNLFKEKVNAVVKTNKLKASASELNAVYNGISWYDAQAIKVEKGTIKLTGNKLEKVLKH